MARDKLITIRIEGEKRDAFNQLAKSQNTDTASLLYDFINQCLDGRIDISLVTGKGQRIDIQIDDDRLNKIDNRIDKLETTTQRLAKRLDDGIEAIDDRLTDYDQGFSEKITSLEHRINALSSQKDSHKDSHKLDRIDTDSQQDRQKDSQQDSQLDSHKDSQLDSQKREASIASPSPSPNQESVEPADTVGMSPAATANYLKTKKIAVSYDSLRRWADKGKISHTPQGRAARKWLTLIDGLYYPIER